MRLFASAATAALVLSSCGLGSGADPEISRSADAGPRGPGSELAAASPAPSPVGDAPVVPPPAAPVQPADTASSPDPAPAYLDSTFRMFLGRAPTEQDVARWLPTVRQGDLSRLTRTLAVTQEAMAIRVDHLYRSILGRAPDDAGLSHWVAALAAGTSTDVIAADLLGSDEYVQRRGASADRFVEGIYADVLGRMPDAAGHAHFLHALESGTSREDLARSLLESPEARQRRVDEVYRSVLGRDPDGAGAAYWVEALGRIDEAAMAAELAASPELFRRATGQESTRAAERAKATGSLPYGMAGGVTLFHPAAAIDVLAFHQASSGRALTQDPGPQAIHPMQLPSRGRGTGERTAVDVVVPPDTGIHSPVTGRVEVATPYRLYCEHPDEKLVIVPDEDPGVRVTLLHLEGLQVVAGDRVVGGETPIAARARVLPFRSQVETYTASPPWPHVHIEASRPVVPDVPTTVC